MATARAAFAGNAAPAFARTAGRAVHVKIHPQPHDLAESREVLRVLQRYGEVVMYKHLKVSTIMLACSLCSLLSVSSILADLLIWD